MDCSAFAVAKEASFVFPTVSVFGYEIATYSIAALVGIAFAAIYVWRTVKDRKNIDQIQIVSIPAMAFIGAFIGAHIMYGITHLDKLWWCITHINTVFESFDSFLFYANDIFGGMVFYGGLIGGMIIAVLYCKKQKLDIRYYADLFAPAIPLFHAFGRVGCFLGGCCYGIECQWGVVYPHETVTRLPIQLFESVGDIVIFFILVILSHKKIKKGTLFLLYLIMYGILRIITEFFRGDVIRGFVWGISTSQWISMILIIVSCIIFFVRSRKYKTNTD